jgi:hypothetical protein
VCTCSRTRCPHALALRPCSARVSGAYLSARCALAKVNFTAFPLQITLINLFAGDSPRLVHERFIPPRPLFLDDGRASPPFFGCSRAGRPLAAHRHPCARPSSELCPPIVASRRSGRMPRRSARKFSAPPRRPSGLRDGCSRAAFRPLSIWCTHLYPCSGPPSSSNLSRGLSGPSSRVSSPGSLA